MTRLVHAEALRLLGRRFTLITLLVVVLGIGLFQIQVAFAVNPPSADEVAANRADYQRAVKQWEETREEFQTECVASGETPERCREFNPRPSEAEWGLSAVPFAEIGPVAGQLAIYLSALALFFVAASFIGAEFTSGSIANWLTFVPRRGAVFATKLATVTGFALVVSALASALALGVAAALTVGFGGGLVGLGPLVAQAGRGLLVAVALAVVGFCVGLVTRHTAAAIGVLVGYLFVFFVRTGILYNQAWAQELTRWSPEGNLTAIVAKGTTFQVPRNTLTDEGISVEYLERTISLGDGLVYWAALLAVLVAASLLIFRRRDIN